MYITLIQLLFASFSTCYCRSEQFNEMVSSNHLNCSRKTEFFYKEVEKYWIPKHIHYKHSVFVKLISVLIPYFVHTSRYIMSVGYVNGRLNQSKNGRS